MSPKQVIKLRRLNERFTKEARKHSALSTVGLIGFVLNTFSLFKTAFGDAPAIITEYKNLSGFIIAVLAVWCFDRMVFYDRLWNVSVLRRETTLALLSQRSRGVDITEDFEEFLYEIRNDK